MSQTATCTSRCRDQKDQSERKEKHFNVNCKKTWFNFCIIYLIMNKFFHLGFPSGIRLSSAANGYDRYIDNSSLMRSLESPVAVDRGSNSEFINGSISYYRVARLDCFKPCFSLLLFLDYWIAVLLSTSLSSRNSHLSTATAPRLSLSVVLSASNVSCPQQSLQNRLDSCFENEVCYFHRTKHGESGRFLLCEGQQRFNVVPF